jgi:hypothetical protein
VGWGGSHGELGACKARQQCTRKRAHTRGHKQEDTQTRKQNRTLRKQTQAGEATHGVASQRGNTNKEAASQAEKQASEHAQTRRQTQANRSRSCAHTQGAPPHLLPDAAGQLVGAGWGPHGRAGPHLPCPHGERGGRRLRGHNLGTQPRVLPAPPGAHSVRLAGPWQGERHARVRARACVHVRVIQAYVRGLIRSTQAK